MYKQIIMPGLPYFSFIQCSAHMSSHCVSAGLKVIDDVIIAALGKLSSIQMSFVGDIKLFHLFFC